MYARSILLLQDYVRCACALHYNKGVSVYCTQLRLGIGKYAIERERERQNEMTDIRSYQVWRDLALLCYQGPEH